MFAVISSLFHSIRQGLLTWAELQAEILALRHQLLILQRANRGGRLRLYWGWKSRHRQGRPAISREVIDLIRRISMANPRRGAPRIHGKLVKLGFELSGATVAKYMVRHRKPPSQTWRTFLANHAKDMVASDLFVVPKSRESLQCVAARLERRSFGWGRQAGRWMS
jgi:hypothetical protein